MSNLASLDGHAPSTNQVFDSQQGKRLPESQSEDVYTDSLYLLNFATAQPNSNAIERVKGDGLKGKEADVVEIATWAAHRFVSGNYFVGEASGTGSKQQRTDYCSRTITPRHK